jgi:hypothetical protein
MSGREDLIQTEKIQNKKQSNSIPSYCIYRDKRARVLYYWSKDLFMILDHKDDNRLVHRNEIRFIK